MGWPYILIILFPNFHVTLHCRNIAHTETVVPNITYAISTHRAVGAPECIQGMVVTARAVNISSYLICLHYVNRSKRLVPIVHQDTLRCVDTLSTAHARAHARMYARTRTRARTHTRTHARTQTSTRTRATTTITTVQRACNEVVTSNEK